MTKRMRTTRGKRTSRWRDQVGGAVRCKLKELAVRHNAIGEEAKEALEAAGKKQGLKVYM